MENNELFKKIEIIKKTNTKYDEDLIKIKITNNYKQFKNIVGNRAIRSLNFSNLTASMKEKQLIIPIVCNEKLEIVDGQHRFEVCKKLKLPVYYYIIPNYDLLDVQKANLISCNWGIDDYLHMFISMDKQEYINFKNLKKECGLGTSLLLEVCSVLEQKNLKEVKYSFKNGLYNIQNVMKLYSFLNELNDFKHLKCYRSSTFVRAFLKLYSYEYYDHVRMKKKLKNLYYKLEKRNLVSDYVNLLVDDIYCFGTTTDRFRYDVKTQHFYSIA